MSDAIIGITVILGMLMVGILLIVICDIWSRK